MTFDALGIPPPLLRALRDEGYERPTPIQEKAIPPVRQGRDVLGCAQTGTGKTAAFALPILEWLDKERIPLEKATPTVLVLAPTRELAAQIDESFGVYGKYLRIAHTVIFGGVGQDKQVRALERGVHVLVATPGRLLDLIGQKLVYLDGVEILVLDEADRMLDMGFLPDVKRVLREVPRDRQTLFFSATMPPAIRELADSMLDEPVEVAVAPPATTAQGVSQFVYFVDKNNKRGLLVDLLERDDIQRALVFTRTKHGANRVAEHLHKAGITALAIHGNKSQNARERALAGFKGGSIRVLVATDLAARGLDIEAVSHVVNFDIPNEPESYVHRIGRTARAGASGIAWAFCDRDERGFLAAIERTTGQRVPVIDDHSFRMRDAMSTDALHPRKDAHGGRAPRPARQPPPGQPISRNAKKKAAPQQRAQGEGAKTAPSAPGKRPRRRRRRGGGGGGGGGPPAPRS